jgi:hypothetical protein
LECKEFLVTPVTLVLAVILVIKDQQGCKGHLAIQATKDLQVQARKVHLVILAIQVLQVFQVILVIKDQQELEPKVHLAIPVILDLQV